MPLRELERLTNAETLVIFRRRSGLTQNVAAKKFEVSRDMYSRWERDIHPGIPRQKVPDLTNAEVCFLYRRRSKMTQEKVASELGCCRYWLNLMERGLTPCGDLIEYWEV